MALANEGESKSTVLAGSVNDPDTLRYFSLSVQPGFDVRILIIITIIINIGLFICYCLLFCDKW